jgi:hypothetical protein
MDKNRARQGIPATFRVKDFPSLNYGYYRK